MKHLPWHYTVSTENLSQRNKLITESFKDLTVKLIVQFPRVVRDKLRSISLETLHETTVNGRINTWSRILYYKEQISLKKSLTSN